MRSISLPEGEETTLVTTEDAAELGSDVDEIGAWELDTDEELSAVLLPEEGATVKLGADELALLRTALWPMVIERLSRS